MPIHTKLFYLQLNFFSILSNGLTYIPKIFLMYLKHLHMLILLMCLTFTASCSPFSTSFNQHYIRADRVGIDTSSTFQNSSASNWSPLSYTVSYAEAFPYAVNVSAAISTDSMHIFQSGSALSFSGKLVNKTNNQLIFNFESTMTANIKVLGYRYIIFVN